jgi:SAM-dependent methyltransferase
MSANGHAELEARERVLSRPPNLDFLLARRTAFLRRFLKPGDRVLEIGAGFGIVPLYVKGVTIISTDVYHKPWLDAIADAMRLPFKDQAFDAVVCLNVLHHLAHPSQAVGEMIRVVRPGGALLVAEPHASVSMRMALALTRHEGIDATVDPFGPESCQTGGTPDGGNNAIGDLLFEDMRRFRQAFPELSLEHHRLVECLTFLNSGGVGFRVPCVPLPRRALDVVGRIDDWLVRFPGVFPMCRELVLRKSQ